MKIEGKYGDICGEYIQADDGKVRKLSTEEANIMSSCFFDEDFRKDHDEVS